MIIRPYYFCKVNHFIGLCIFDHYDQLLSGWGFLEGGDGSVIKRGFKSLLSWIKDLIEFKLNASIKIEQIFLPSFMCTQLVQSPGLGCIDRLFLSTLSDSD